jgi:hypothetical protein
MTTHNLYGDESFDFALQKEIDAACDRLEDDRKSGRPGCIETYLEESAPAQREQYFRKLLWTDLALTPPADWQLAEQQYLHRFPEYRSIITAVINEVRTALSLESHAEDHAHAWKVVGHVQQRLRRATATSMGESTVLGPYEISAPLLLPPSESTAAELWQLLLKYSESLSAAPEESRQRQVDQLETVLGEFLAAFPAVRRQVLTSILLGSTLAQTSKQHRVTLRTVEVTCQAAKSLLSTYRPGSENRP